MTTRWHIKRLKIEINDSKDDDSKLKLQMQKLKWYDNALQTYCIKIVFFPHN